MSSEDVSGRNDEEVQVGPNVTVPQVGGDTTDNADMGIKLEESNPVGGTPKRLRKKKSDSAFITEPLVRKRKNKGKGETIRGKRSCLNSALAYMTTVDRRNMTKVMEEEVRKTKPNLMFLAKAMAQTFQVRWKTVCGGEKQIKAIVEKYPALLNYEILKEEYNCVHAKYDKMESLENALADVLRGALRIKPTYQHPIALSAKEKYSQTLDRGKQLEKVLGMLVLSFYFAKENVETSLCRFLNENEILEQSEVKKLVYPTLVLKRSDMFATQIRDCWIYVEAGKYLQVPNFYEGVLCMYAMYYIFNLHYDPRLTHLFEFFDMVNGNPQSTFTKTKSLWDQMLLQRAQE